MLKRRRYVDCTSLIAILYHTPRKRLGIIRPRLKRARFYLLTTTKQTCSLRVAPKASRIPIQFETMSSYIGHNESDSLNTGRAIIEYARRHPPSRTTNVACISPRSLPHRSRDEGEHPEFQVLCESPDRGASVMAMVLNRLNDLGLRG